MWSVDPLIILLGMGHNTDLSMNSLYVLVCYKMCCIFVGSGMLNVVHV